jgi:hypothetical protein
MKCGVPVDDFGRGPTLALLLGSSLALGATIASASLSGSAIFGLGWSHNPGRTLLVVLSLVLLAGRLQRVRARELILIGVSCVIPLFLEFLPLGRKVWVLLGVSLPLLGLVLAARPGPSLGWRFSVVGLAAYIQSVFIYNALSPMQLMTFFRPGWTA